jgi:hypothetical protein
MNRPRHMLSHSLEMAVYGCIAARSLWLDESERGAMSTEDVPLTAIIDRYVAMAKWIFPASQCMGRNERHRRAFKKR